MTQRIGRGPGPQVTDRLVGIPRGVWFATAEFAQQMGYSWSGNASGRLLELANYGYIEKREQQSDSGTPRKYEWRVV